MADKNHPQYLHGHATKTQTTPTYISYTAAKQRCGNPNHMYYYNYGGRGIEFRFKTFDEFYAELGPRPVGKSLDRIDNDGHYEKGNVRWATGKEQLFNQRPRKMVAA